MIKRMALVLINLRIPSLMINSADDGGPKRIDNSGVRFLKAVELPAVPSPGAVLDMTALEVSAPFSCRVRQANWDEHENRFVVACSYAKPSIREADYRALLSSSDWISKSLL